MNSEHVLEVHSEFRVRVRSLLQDIVGDSEVHVALFQFLEGLDSAALLINRKIIITLIIVGCLLAESVPVRSRANRADAIIDQDYAA